MRSFRFSLLLAAFLLTACTATPEPLPTPVPANPPVPPPSTPSAPLPLRADLLRVAVLGEATTTNVWALFDEAGAGYWNYATQAAYWPRLYQLTPASLDSSARSGQGLAPAAAKGEPSPVVCDAATCTARVSLQPNLAWTDGSPLTADDVAFTANTALRFQLGLNWRQAYDPDVLEHVEALDEGTVKFYFRGMPTVADWQYGVLQGPILNRAYWQPRIVEAVSLLPEEGLLPTIRELEGELAEMQSQVDSLNLSLDGMAPASTVYQDTSRQAQGLQEELNSVYNKLEKARAEFETKSSEARAALFALANANEPTLGAWRFESRIAGSFENRAHLGTPFGDPWFDNVRYITYPNEASAVSALLADEVDVILTPAGLAPDSVARLENDPEITLSRNVTRSARFLAFNHANPYLAEPALHQALACMLDPQTMAAGSSGEVAALTAFVLDDFWRNREASLPCAGTAGDTRLAEAVRLLKAAGYTWSKEPTQGMAGQGLKAPDGALLPRFSLLAPSHAEDTQRAETADYIARQAGLLGLSLDVRLSDTDQVLYEVYGSSGYDLALLGWRLSAYPAYLCGWFTPSGENPFAYNGTGLKSACEALEATSDLQLAKNHVFEIQSILMQDLPIIPLYAAIRYDAYRNVRYPFDTVVDGLAGLYAAPALAIPIPK